MILTTIINHQLCIRFDTWIKKGTIKITGDGRYNRSIGFVNSDFEIIDIPENIHHIRVVIHTGDEVTTKNLKL
jgi:hypothetical protein